MKRLLSASLLVLFGTSAFVFASCADAGDSATPPAVSPSADGGTEDGASDARADDAGDCDASICPRELTCDEAAWCPTTTSIDARRTLTSIWGSSKNDVWVVGSVGTIAHFDGTSWAVVPSSTKETLRAVWGSSATNVWVVSTPGTLLHGNGWQGGSAAFDPAPAIPRVVEHVATLTLAVWGSSADDVWLAGEPIPLDWDFVEHAPAWRKADPSTGTDWANEFVARRSDPVTLRSLWGSGPDDVWAVGGDEREIVHPDGTTSLVSSGRAFHASPGDSGALAWTEHDTQSNAILYAVWGMPGGDVWSVGRRGAIRRFVRDAARWEQVPSPTTQTLRALWGSSANDVWAVGERGTVLHYDGTDWTLSSAAFPSGPRPNLYGVWGSGKDDVWAVGEGGLLHFSGKNIGGAP